ncbi:MAG: PIN domain-containing protein [Candidatus Freyarchaeota archaeon]|nr:PIN domain-containing protein [Candidatus Jordarchaeia archaeon]MBS7268097.1 PIN domain-containing protein [Candidatus Jordarchaeia archaeon]MBS7279000.1 PIN domain-containing protein [Candidatus Jordarchaeia archaeon]
MNFPRGEANITEFIVETDILLALISREDKHHTEVVKLLDKFAGEIQLSPYSLIELDLLLKSEEIIVAESKTFYSLVGKVLKYRQIGLSEIKPEYHGKAWELREKNKELTYFDSLHAAVGLMENLELVSYDKEYTKIEGLKYSPPNKYL